MAKHKAIWLNKKNHLKPLVILISRVPSRYLQYDPGVGHGRCRQHRQPQKLEAGGLETTAKLVYN
jgi:hypothetical protein